MKIMPHLAIHMVDSRVEDYPPHEATAVTALPDCAICKNVLHMLRPRPAMFDGKTHAGPWAAMCHPHFESHGIKLGEGYGQRLVIPGIDAAVGRHPAGKARLDYCRVCGKRVADFEVGGYEKPNGQRGHYKCDGADRNE